MSFQADVEHIYAPPETLPDSLAKWNPTTKEFEGMFAKGACTIFADEKFVAAMPATNEQTHQLADLMEGWAVALDDDWSGAGKDYAIMAMQLCHPHGKLFYTRVFAQEMTKQQDIEEDPAANKFRALASASRPKLNGNGH